MEEKKKLYQKWWFWVCIVLLTLIVGSVLIMMVGFKIATSGISEVAMTVQSIDNEATVYSSAGNNTIVVEIPNYTDDTKKSKKENIENIIKDYCNYNGILSNYSKFVLITKINSDNKENYFYNINVYDLPSMVEDIEKSKVYLDFVEFTKESLGSTTTSSSNNANTTTKGENIELTQGSYVVGEDVKPGKYDVIAINGTSGNINIEGGSYHDILSDKKNNYGWEKTYKNLTLKNGQIVEITNGLQVKLEAK